MFMLLHPIVCSCSPIILISLTRANLMNRNIVNKTIDCLTQETIKLLDAKKIVLRQIP